MRFRQLTSAHLLPIAITVLLLSTAVFAQTDEIQVYDAQIAQPGGANLMIHTNFTPVGRKQPAFTDAIIANDSINGTAEWAYGVKSWFEQGLYLPVYSLHSSNHGATINGFKIRELLVRPHAHDRKFFWGLNFEFSVNALYWEPKRVSSECGPFSARTCIVGISSATQSWTRTTPAGSMACSSIPPAALHTT